MSSKGQLEAIKKNADRAEETVQELRKELTTLSNQYNKLLVNQLREENKELKLAVKAAKKNLIQLEVQNGIQQIALPKQQLNGLVLGNVKIIEEANVIEAVVEQKAKKAKVAAKEKSNQAVELPVDIGRLDLRIGKIEEVQKHPDADTLFILKVNCGEEKLRVVCSALVNFIPSEALLHRVVVVLCNLKPVKMRGVTSEAMLMCAWTPEKIETLLPPEGSVPGDLVYCDGFGRNPDEIMNPKKKIFETVLPHLFTNDLLEACYKGAPLKVPGKGTILVATLKNCLVK